MSASGAAVQSAAVRTGISVTCFWTETVAYAVCAVLIWLFTARKDLPYGQKMTTQRKQESVK